MHVIFSWAWLLGLLGPAAPPVPMSAPATWEQAFATAADAPERVHWRAIYLDERGLPHGVEVWRDGDRRLHRATDGRIDLYVTREAAGELTFDLVDRARGAKFHGTRTDLYRLGVFADWDGLAHALVPPRGAYSLTATPQIPGAPCQWARLAVGGAARDVCWSPRWGVPVAIRGQWWLLGADATPDPTAFTPPATGLVALDLADERPDRD